MTMKPANLSLLKLSSISSRCLLGRSGQVEGRSFVTIFNPAAPKLKRLQRSPGFEAQTPPAESEKVSMLRKALEEAKNGVENLFKVAFDVQKRRSRLLVEAQSNMKVNDGGAQKNHLILFFARSPIPPK